MSYTKNYVSNIQTLISDVVLSQISKNYLRLQTSKYQELKKRANCINHIKTKKKRSAFFNAENVLYLLTLVLKLTVRW